VRILAFILFAPLLLRDLWCKNEWFLFLCVLLSLLTILFFLHGRLTLLKKERRELQRLRKAHNEIRTLAYYDSVTALPNRRLMLERLEKILTSDSHKGFKRALLKINIDNFKLINDTLGHEAGDQFLRTIALRLTSSIREADTIARPGADKFILLLNELSASAEQSAAQAEAIAARILELIEVPFRIEDREFQFGAFIGITIFGNGQETATEILQQTEIALAQSKEAGRNAVRFFAPTLQAAVNARAQLEADLHQSIRDRHFVLYYQPQWEMEQLTGAEALVRWNHPTRGLLAPGAFIPLAEESGLIIPLGNFILDEACHRVAEWARTPETAGLHLSVNISAHQFRQPDFVDTVLETIRKNGADPTHLMLELTESTLVENFDDVIKKMTLLNEHGLRFSLDDFGTGYSSLAYLGSLPLAEIKIDRAFVLEIFLNHRISAIIEGIVSIGRALSMKIIAEGVESEGQRAALISIGCTAFQGFLFSPPIPSDEFTRMAQQVGNAAQ